VTSGLSAYFFYADTPRRRAALATKPGAAERYALYGLDQLAERGLAVAHNLERREPLPRWTRLADGAVNGALRRLHGTGGDLATGLASLGAANRADVVVATIDRLGIPLTLLAQIRLLRAPLVYVSIGLPERLERLRGAVRAVHLRALRRADAFVAYSTFEADVIRRDVAGRFGAPVSFVPFGVDPSFFRPASRDEQLDVVSVGADPHRDYPLLLQLAVRRPEWRFRLVVTRDAARRLPRVPDNVTLETEIPLADVRDRLAAAGVVALPVLDNSYSGATTVLLQAMACGRPVVVTRTAAIAEGYGLADDDNVRLVAPGSVDEFEAAVSGLLADGDRAATLGRRARAHVEATLTWERYVERLHDVLAETAARHSG
jgi:glycosyltransferase involved in cell wall biosynthesis